MNDLKSIEQKLLHAVTVYDAKQPKKCYNRYALPLFMNAVESTLNDIEKGMTPLQALNNNFNDRLLDYLIKSLN